MLAGIPLGRFGVPHEVWLALKFKTECDYLMGRVILVDGGFTPNCLRAHSTRLLKRTSILYVQDVVDHCEGVQFSDLLV